MAHDVPAATGDEQLRTLLSVEARLESAIRQAEADAAALVAAARAEAGRAAASQAARSRAEAEAEARADAQAQAQALADLRKANATRVAALAVVPDEVVDRMARRALALAAGLPGGLP